MHCVTNIYGEKANVIVSNVAFSAGPQAERLDTCKTVREQGGRVGEEPGSQDSSSAAAAVAALYTGCELLADGAAVRTWCGS